MEMCVVAVARGIGRDGDGGTSHRELDPGSTQRQQEEEEDDEKSGRRRRRKKRLGERNAQTNEPKENDEN